MNFVPKVRSMDKIRKVTEFPHLHFSWVSGPYFWRVRMGSGKKKSLFSVAFFLSISSLQSDYAKLTRDYLTLELVRLGIVLCACVSKTK